MFSLYPLNERSIAAIDDPVNEPFVSIIFGKRVYDIGHFKSKSSVTTLATLGRGDTDIFLDGPAVSKIQCSFEINPETGLVMFYDRSHGCTSQVHGDISFPFEYNRPRKVVVMKGFNEIIGMGGVGRNIIQFQLIWHHEFSRTMEKVMDRGDTLIEKNPRLSQTIDDTDIIPPSGPDTRLHTAGQRQPKLRFQELYKLGSGQFGVVYKAINVDLGTFLAVKTLSRPQARSEQEWKELLKGPLRREVKNLSQSKHVSNAPPKPRSVPPLTPRPAAYH